MIDIESAVKSLERLAQNFLPSWEGEAAVAGIDAIRYLKNQNTELRKLTNCAIDKAVEIASDIVRNRGAYGDDALAAEIESEISATVLVEKEINHAMLNITYAAGDVSDGVYANVIKLQEALRAVHALAGESPEIAKICADAILETGGHPRGSIRGMGL